MRVDDRERRREGRAARDGGPSRGRRCPRRRATAISAVLVDPQSTVTITVGPARCGRVEGGEGQAVALVEPARHVRQRVDARSGGAPGSGSRARSGRPRRSRRRPALARRASRARAIRASATSASGSSGGSWSAGSRIGKPGRRARPRRSRRARRAMPATRGTEPAPRAASSSVGRGDGRRESPAVAGFDHSVRMPRGAAPRLLSAAGAARAVRASRGGRAAPGPLRARPCRRSSQSCQSTSSGAAMKIEE